MDNSQAIIRKKSNATNQAIEKSNPIPPMINSEKLIANLKKITLLDILDQFARDSESKSIIEILRSIMGMGETDQDVQYEQKGDFQNNYKDKQRFESNGQERKKYNSDFQNIKQTDHRVDSQYERGRCDDKNYNTDRRDRNDKYERNQRQERRYKHDNQEDRYDRYNRHDKQDRKDRNDRNERYDKQNKYDKYRNDSQKKGREDNENETKYIKSDWIIRMPELDTKEIQYQRIDNQSQAPL